MRYYIDTQNGRPDADGQSPENARNEYRDLPVRPGDSVLFRRGNVIRKPLRRVPGTPDAYVVYGAWGEGPAPLFSGTILLNDPDDFREIRPNLWECTRFIPDEICNLIFDHGRRGGTLRWSPEDVKKPGDWYDSRIGKREEQTFSKENTGERLLLYCEGNPVRAAVPLEIVPWGERHLSQNVSCTTLEDLAFRGSGVHALSGGAHHMTVRRCSFGYIGGAVWNKEQRIRFGNAIEFWNLGENILIEDCYFNNIYDSCITHQGSSECTPAKNLVMRGNLFVGYGMAAYEGRDLVSLDSSFRDNLCIDAGGGFSGFGDTVPRRSEIYPLPMGHHVFLWRQEKETPGGSLVIENNLFGPATGAAVYSISANGADRQQTQKNNHYDLPDGALCCRRQGTDYTKEAWAENREEGARFGDADIPARISEWFARTHADRMGMPVFTDKTE